MKEGREEQPFLLAELKYTYMMQGDLELRNKMLLNQCIGNICNKISFKSTRNHFSFPKALSVKPIKEELIENSSKRLFSSYLLLYFRQDFLKYIL